MAGYSSLSATVITGVSTFSASENASTPKLSAQATTGQPFKTLQYSTSQANNAATSTVSGADSLYSAILSVSTSSSSTVDMTSLTGNFGVSLNLARVKFISAWLLAVADDATNGTACSSVTIDTTVANGFIGPWVSSATWYTINNSVCAIILNEVSGTGYVVSGTHKVLKFTNNDASNAAAILLTIVGGSS